jgi:hypothetical protein
MQVGDNTRKIARSFLSALDRVYLLFARNRCDLICHKSISGQLFLKYMIARYSEFLIAGRSRIKNGCELNEIVNSVPWGGKEALPYQSVSRIPILGYGIQRIFEIVVPKPVEIQLGCKVLAYWVSGSNVLPIVGCEDVPKSGPKVIT